MRSTRWMLVAVLALGLIGLAGCPAEEEPTDTGTEPQIEEPTGTTTETPFGTTETPGATGTPGATETTP